MAFSLRPLNQTPTLNATDRAQYEWQLSIDGLGEEGQRRLKGSSVLISRVGGVGGNVALHLAAAGVGKLILAHAGNAKPSDLHRQLLLNAAAVGRPRSETYAQRLRELNPQIEVVSVAENISDDNAGRLVQSADLVVDCAPLFSERFALNRACVQQSKPLVESSMYALEGQVTTILPGQTPCLACLVPEDPPAWQRQFPVISPISGVIGSLAAMEAIKVLTGLGEPLLGKLLLVDLRGMSFQQVQIERNANCPVCGISST